MEAEEVNDYAELIERLKEAEVREPRTPSGMYQTILGDQAAAAISELVAERDAALDLERRMHKNLCDVMRERDEAMAEVERLRDEVAQLCGYYRGRERA